jgi:hypothetical protein
LPSVPLHYVVGCHGTGGAGQIIGNVRRPFGCPALHDRIDDLPRLVDPVCAGEERLVTLHDIEQEPGVGRAVAGERFLPFCNSDA